MNTIEGASVTIQTSPESVPAVPVWFGEMTVIAHHLRHLGVLSAITTSLTLSLYCWVMPSAVYAHLKPSMRVCTPSRLRSWLSLDRLDEVCAPGYFGRKRGETVRTRTTVLQSHTHQWVGTFSGASGAGNGDYRGELRQAAKAISAYPQAQSLQPSQAVVRLDGQYGNGAILADLAGLAYVMRGKDYDLLDLESVQARLAQPPDQQTSHPETGTYRALFDFPDLSLSPTGSRIRVIVATHQAAPTKAPVGTTHGEMVYELFYTALHRLRMARPGSPEPASPHARVLSPVFREPLRLLYGSMSLV